MFSIGMEVSPYPKEDERKPTVTVTLTPLEVEIKVWEARGGEGDVVRTERGCMCCHIVYFHIFTVPLCTAPFVLLSRCVLPLSAPHRRIAGR